MSYTIDTIDTIESAELDYSDLEVFDLKGWDVVDASDTFGPHYLPNDISYFAVDFKVNKKGDIKILEFQDGPNAGFRSYDYLFEKKGKRGEIWRRWWTYAQQFGAPMWYVGPKPVVTKLDGSYKTDEERVALKDFFRMGGTYCHRFSDLLKDERIQLLRGRKNVDGIRGIVLVKNGLPQSARRWYARLYPSLIFVNIRSVHFTRNKRASNKWFSGRLLSEHRPQCKLYNKIYSPVLSRKILRDFDSDKVVIKPVNSSRSNGVLVVEREHLDEVLQGILQTKPAEELKELGYRRYRPADPKSYDYWDGDANTVFMVEEFIESSYLEVNGKLYDPTFRMALAMSCINGKIDITCLEGFRKLPRLSVKDHGEITDRHVSKHRHDLALLPVEKLEIKPDEMRVLSEKFNVIFSKAYRKILMASDKTI
jgi:hypothetical protein